MTAFTPAEKRRLRAEILSHNNPADRLRHLEALGLADDVIRAEAQRINNGADLIAALTALGYC